MEPSSVDVQVRTCISVHGISILFRAVSGRFGTWFERPGGEARERNSTEHTSATYQQKLRPICPEGYFIFNAGEIHVGGPEAPTLGFG